MLVWDGVGEFGFECRGGKFAWFSPKVQKHLFFLF